MDIGLTIGMATDGAAARFALTTSEADRCARLPTARRRSDFRAGRLAAKRAASARMERHLERLIEVSTSADGTPILLQLDDRGRSTRLAGALSISHCHGRAVAAIASDGVRVGVDLARTGSVPTPAARHFLTPAEQEVAALVDPTLLWSLKEAASEALGLGRSVPFSSVEVRLDDAGRLLGVRVRGAFVRTYSLVSNPWPDFRMAAVWVAGAIA